ncbi:hypothetical protein ABTM90_19740, partial [Acinetobacter baumannii]
MGEIEPSIFKETFRSPLMRRIKTDAAQAGLVALVSSLMLASETAAQQASAPAASTLPSIEVVGNRRSNVSTTRVNNTPPSTD